MSFLYWVYDDTCDSVLGTGYVGVTEDPPVRLQQLRQSRTVPRNAKLRVLYEGTRAQCLARERALRPYYHQGWNRDVGGKAAYPSRHGLRPVGPDPFKDFWR